MLIYYARIQLILTNSANACVEYLAQAPAIVTPALLMFTAPSFLSVYQTNNKLDLVILSASLQQLRTICYKKATFAY